MTKRKKCNAQSVTDRQEAIKSICPDGARSVQQLQMAENMMEIEKAGKAAMDVISSGAELAVQLEQQRKEDAACYAEVQA